MAPFPESRLSKLLTGGVHLRSFFCLTVHIDLWDNEILPNEVLIALAICAATNPTAATAIDQLDKLRGCEAHSSVILSQVDENVFNRLGMNITFDPAYQTNRLYHN